ncbi:hypothetical protein CEUSTIGMA_g2484.t1 [Chlamydomonas eustigma]|uniref:Cell division cycle protein 123 n=1 Tax=Chlamydomonas eustigma TaxID=1157962 RepID=A0A250WWY6_9CHLO|nr:hypothetical protein CEUSTIGMA_g2484.t1 [Chlamydomonas eustigma]|eukprot:GAX75040.1 hypothetical protein CEUSTIGMA_g2484.t1 [Chlamydomonas eustigma]
MCNTSTFAATDISKECSHHQWIQHFRGSLLPTELVQLPPEIVDYLLEDGIFLGDSSHALPKRGCQDDEDEEEGYKEWSSDDGHDAHSVQDSAEPSSQTPHDRITSHGDSDSTASSSHDTRPWHLRFPDLYQQLSAAIDRVGGSGVIPKLNWSCPSDATWVNPSTTLLCSNPDQVMLMLKSSVRVTHDLEILRDRQQQQQHSAVTHDSAAESGVQQSTIPPVLVLRKWCNLLPEREFRCFVRSRNLVGVCQRDVSQHFPQMVETGTPDVNASHDMMPGVAAVPMELSPVQGIKQALQDFHQHTVQTSHFPLLHFVYDVYVTTSLVVKLVDINPIGGTTSPLLYSWEELGYDADELELQGALPYQQASPSHLSLQLNSEAAELAGDSSTSSLNVHQFDAVPTQMSQLTGNEHMSQSSHADVIGSNRQHMADSTRSWPLRFVARGEGMQAGHRAACAMPHDMLSLQGDQSGSMAQLLEQMQFFSSTRPH